ncbi:MAG: DUF4199 domain-containing protein [Flavobacteriales bacterium]|nr:DUF4199 domain-containing protein [Flavobacteriales bacterium]
MKKVVLVYSLLSGVILAILMFCTFPLWDSGVVTMDNSMVVGYITMIVSLSLIFFAVKNFRDRHQEGVISFGKAFSIGLLITLLAGVIYAIAWEIALKTVATNFVDMMTEHYLKTAIDSGADEAKIAQVKLEMDEFKVMYANPVIRFPMTMLEILPVGLLFSAISGLILRKKKA